jgi:DedD protein
MAKRQMDSEDDLKWQTRRRLVGAVALFTALVVIVPMVLDREPKPSGQDIDLRIPDKDKMGEFTSQMVLPESAVASASEPVAGSAPDAMAKPATAETVQEAVPAPAKQEKPSKPEHKAAPSAPAKGTQPKEGFAVQVGAFANAASAAELRDKLHKRGWPAYTEKAGGAVRVRVGLYPTREAADKALHNLEAQGMHPTLVSAP